MKNNKTEMGLNNSKITNSEDLLTNGNNNHPGTEKSQIQLNGDTSDDSENENPSLDISNRSHKNSSFIVEPKELEKYGNSEFIRESPKQHMSPQNALELSAIESTLVDEINEPLIDDIVSGMLNKGTESKGLVNRKLKRQLTPGENSTAPLPKKQRIDDGGSHKGVGWKIGKGRKMTAARQRLREENRLKWMESYREAIEEDWEPAPWELSENENDDEDDDHFIPSIPPPREFAILMQALKTAARRRTGRCTPEPKEKKNGQDLTNSQLKQFFLDPIEAGGISFSSFPSTDSEEDQKSHRNLDENNESFLNTDFYLPSDTSEEVQIDDLIENGDESRSTGRSDVDMFADEEESRQAADDIESNTIANSVVNDNKDGNGADESREREEDEESGADAEEVGESIKTDLPLNKGKSTKSAVIVESQEIIDVPSSDDESPSTGPPIASIDEENGTPTEEVEELNGLPPEVLVNPFFKNNRKEKNAKVVKANTTVSTFQLPEAFDMEYLEITIIPVASTDKDSSRMSESIKIRAKNSKSSKVVGKKEAKALRSSMGTKKSRDKKVFDRNRNNDEEKRQKEIVEIDLADSDD